MLHTQITFLSHNTLWTWCSAELTVLNVSVSDRMSAAEYIFRVFRSSLKLSCPTRAGAVLSHWVQQALRSDNHTVQKLQLLTRLKCGMIMGVLPGVTTDEHTVVGRTIGWFKELYGHMQPNVRASDACRLVRIYRCCAGCTTSESQATNMTCIPDSATAAAASLQSHGERLAQCEVRLNTIAIDKNSHHHCCCCCCCCIA